MKKDKIRFFAGLLLVFFVILATYRIDQANFDKVEDSIITIYEDRLVVKDLIFKIADLLDEKRMALATSDTAFFQRRNAVVDAQIGQLLRLFRETRLTENEERTLTDFGEQIEQLQAAEAEMANPATHPDRDELSTRLEVLKGQARTLSDIQLSEGKRQLLIGSRAIRSSKLLMQVELIVLIVLALGIQFLVLQKPRRKTKEPKEPEEKTFKGKIT
ncbi:MCP four helix bundle domain-containing protein [Robiginitalea biformata]|uniref:Chemotaxis methyl-accepting receptor HlyB-like 4HB MCP domain-containing protein n=1 Tax=Robiginitalea biformata (strain ATCC BAA-864 / DSM 15991 / KCTC 12146 / HTCC2501) TaxID=313596 RepID=A4CNQ6_ROBBH|nr:MCP four helix bundle domain-containing protein [Robiginitalea biformata]EAR14523.1 hypothetical protein RB2501_00566 [Robiginitalea biformata HTCC2501]